jgi:leucine dehydrogenase
MKTFAEMKRRNHEQIVFGYDKEAGLHAIIAIHDTSLGPALGGTRMWPYKTEKEAIDDVLRLSRGMTYKAAASGLSLGGGKGVIIGDPEKDKNEVLFRAYGRLVEGLHGRFVTGEDVGIDVRDMEWMRAETTYVVGISESLGGGGDPSPVTARGVFFGLQACIEEVFGSGALRGMTVAVQGLGHVGMNLLELLNRAGAKMIVSDIRRDRVTLAEDRYKAKPVSPEAIYQVEAEIFAPCALGAIINDETIPQFKFKIIAGSANNQLADEKKHGHVLKEKGILYAPDYVINAGGLMNVANEIEGYVRERVMKQAEGIYANLKDIFAIAKEEDIPTNVASNRMAERRIERVAKLRRKFVTLPPVHYRGGRIFR